MLRKQTWNIYFQASKTIAKKKWPAGQRLVCSRPSEIRHKQHSPAAIVSDFGRMSSGQRRESRRDSTNSIMSTTTTQQWTTTSVVPKVRPLLPAWIMPSHISHLWRPSPRNDPTPTQSETKVWLTLMRLSNSLFTARAHKQSRSHATRSIRPACRVHNIPFPWASQQRRPATSAAQRSRHSPPAEAEMPIKCRASWWTPKEPNMLRIFINAAAWWDGESCWCVCTFLFLFLFLTHIRSKSGSSTSCVSFFVFGFFEN